MLPRLIVLYFLAIVLSTTVASAGPVPPLTPQQQEVLELASDRTGYDEAALRPLLENAITWQPGDVAGARLPDYEAIAADPVAYRGDAVLIEGDLLRAQRVPIARPGPWGEHLVAWHIRIGEGNTPADLVTVLLPDRDAFAAARRGQSVRVAGRFYKILRTPKVGNGPLTDYLLFVGGDARIVAVTQRNSFDLATDWKRAAMLALVVFSAIGFVLWRFGSGLRLRADPIPLPSQARRRAAVELAAQSRLVDAPPDEDDADTADLPEDPDAALAELQRRHTDTPLDDPFTPPDDQTRHP